MLCAIAHIQYKKLVANTLIMTSTKLPISYVFNKRIIAVVSILIIVKFFALVDFIADKYTYNAFHPYISFCSILCFLFLRNSTIQLRNFHLAGICMGGARLTRDVSLVVSHLACR
jgi:hypothetical protein